MNAQMIRVISSPSSSTIGFLTLILATRRGDAIYPAPSAAPSDRPLRWHNRYRWHRRAHRRRHPRGLQPAAAAGRLQRLRGRPAAGRGGRARGRRLGRASGSPRSARSPARAQTHRARALEANENPPKLRTHDRFGNRIDEVEFHPAWHELMALAVGHELHSLALARPAARAPTSPAAPPSCACRRPRPGSAARSR